MSIQPIITSLQQLLELHQSLLSISENKTEVLKKGDLEALQELLKTERKHVQAINKVEQQRIEQVTSWTVSQKIDLEAQNVTALLEVIDNAAEKEALEAVTTTLAEVLVKLKQQEQLNQQLTQQSLQFVQLSMNMIAPTIQSINYSNKNKSSADNSSKRSVFDSKA
ncbi:hypothetical protein GCM10011351_21940 [Paraliobacillus quinghaiensis]|uniref:Flagellar protein FlgN n=1 Tax=Paraliobacillus quinghaiensis TaxID=470815 RepID=A0A917TS38_9BACI|nr:flagellar protein FlgN [Paraliobacillus quinghaiensis]GGM35452.1 hypothetical protein GCM10011351_21940 [Paraliobacillus quinghaiensis]